MKCIALFSTTELEAFPGVQTVQEQGFGDVFCETYKGLVVPAGTDPAIVEWLEGRFTEMFSDPAWEEFLNANGIFVQPLSGTGMVERMQNEILALWPMMEEFGILKDGAVKPEF